MCRFLFYVGDAIHLSSLITEPEHSLIRQSFKSEQRNEPLNGDGFGVAWYAPEAQPDAAVFRSMTPAWSNQNLLCLSKAIKSGCVLAHVRAASVGTSVNESNTHPFVHGPYAFMHNGALADFWQHRRKLLDTLDDEHYQLVRGVTDTECLFAHILQEIGQQSTVTAEHMAHALESSTARILGELERVGVDKPSRVNAVLCNGKEAVACRYTTALDQPAESLYLHTGAIYNCRSGKPKLIEAREQEQSVIIASEPLTREPTWQAVPNNSIVTVDAGRAVSVRPINIAA